MKLLNKILILQTIIAGIMVGLMIVVFYRNQTLSLRQENLEIYKYNRWLQEAKEVCGGKTVDFKVYEDHLEGTCL